RERGGFDLMVQAMSGIMSVNGPEDGPPHRLPLAIADIGAGMFAAIGILAAAQARARTGLGQRVDASLYDTAVALGVYEAAHVFATGEAPPRIGQAHRSSAPYQVFRTADGWLTIGAANQTMWLRLCEVLACRELADDPRFRDNPARVAHRAALIPLLEAKLSREPSAVWVERLTAAGVPVGPVQTYDQVFADPQVIARDMVAPLDHPAAGRMRTLGIPVKLSATPGELRRPAPRLGEHTAEILAELRRRQGDRS
ncbi:MAG TPA: CoA transferase, partial [Stellaceae bacterium]|nr:CoA transferase [Stellaceae bacterium]